MLFGFIKGNMHRIMRVLVNQIAIMIFAIIVTFTAGMMQDDQRVAMMLVASLFSTAFYFFLVFITMREEGSEDSVKISLGRLPQRPAHGFKIGLCATAPNYICVLLMLSGVILGLAVDESGALAESAAGGGVWSLGYLIATMLQSMYTGILKAIVADFSPFASIVAATVSYAITPLFTPLVAGIGYLYGCKKPMRRSSSSSYRS